MSDHDGGDGRRTRPQYGEYATPEEQRAAIKQPAEWQLEDEQTDEQTDAAQQPPTPGAYQPGSGHAPAPHFPEHHDPHAYPYQRAQQQRVNPWDRLATIILLGLGLLNVIDMISNAASGGELMRQSAETLGGSEEQLLDSVPDWLWVASAVAYSIVWLVALVASLRAMRAGRISFWIPLVAGIVAGLLVIALLVIAVGENPALLNDVPTPGGTGTPT